MRLSSLGPWLILAVAGLAAGAGVQAPAPSPTAWLTGPTLSERLATEIPGVFWSEAPIRGAVRSLSTTHRVAVLIDRRVDPDRKLELTLAHLTLQEVLRQLAEQQGQEISVLGPVVYLGPPEAASRLRTLSALRHEEVRAAGPLVARRFLAAERLRWPDFAAPRDLLSQLAGTAGFEIAGLEQVPHDLWAEADLPALSLIDRLTLIAIQFDLTFEIGPEGRQVRLVPIPEDVAVEREYPAGRDPQRSAQAWASLAPHSRVRVAGDRIVVRGPVEDQEAIAAARRPRASSPPKPSPRKPPESRFTVTGAKGPLGHLLKELAAKLQLELRIDEEALEEAGISLNDQVSFRVTNGTIDELLDAVLAPAGCAFRREGNVVKVFPARVR